MDIYGKSNLIVKKIKFVYYYMNHYIRDINKYRKKFTGKQILNIDMVHEIISAKILSGESFMAARCGQAELFAMRTEEFSIEKKQEKACHQIYVCAGFFPDSVELLKQFNFIMKNAFGKVDLLAIWYHDQPCLDYFVKRYGKNIRNVCISEALLYPFLYENPWTQHLRNKKVLVIHPFQKTIEKQYQKRKFLFKNPDVLPEFQLITMKAVQTIGDQKDERFKTWFEALDSMCHQALEIEFDIALIGCGAYGFPLAAYLKEHKKQVIHLGGALQLMFGIKGRRWDNDKVSNFYNNHWIYPLSTDCIKNPEQIEDGCYWG